MAEISDKRKRQRLNPTHRWTEAETTEFLGTVMEEVKHNPEAFEKPTAQYFYKKIAEKVPSIQALSWTLMKSKMRNLKTSYLKAESWRGQTGAGLLAEGNESSVSEYIHKICPHWQILEQIFGQRKSVNPVVVIDTSSSNYEECINETDVVDQFEETNQEVTCIEEVIEEQVVEQDCDDVPDPTAQPSTSGMNFMAFKNQLKKQPLKRNKATSNSGSISLLVDIQEKKLKFEETKWNKQMQLEEERLQLAKVQMENDIELKKIELQQQMEIRKLELDKEERLAVIRMKLDVECMERIKKYELDLKSNNHV
ncbi:uncharacterized protein LOC134221173 [Armigeres subalbatus]|uniref:uncharacterized protein LOC134221173 n=1 Tax=Armigeres subalbatus TaxID=124917 RepID=UPI002ED5BA26